MDLSSHIHSEVRGKLFSCHLLCCFGVHSVKTLKPELLCALCQASQMSPVLPPSAELFTPRLLPDTLRFVMAPETELRLLFEVDVHQYFVG